MKAVLSKYIRPEVLTRIGHSEFKPRELVEGTLAGGHKSPFHGFAVEFAGHREYVPGDDIRHLDWKVYYRHDRHVIKQYEMETNLVCHFILDMSASMRYGDEDSQKMMYGAQIASTLGFLIVEQSDKVALAMVDEKLRDVVTPSNSMSQILRMTQHLDVTEPTEKTSLGGPLLEYAQQAGRRSIIIILSDFFCDLEDLEAALHRYRYDKHEVVLMQLMHQDELYFNLPGMVKFVGLEVDEQHLTRPDDIRVGYLEAMRRHNHRLDEICEANQCERVLCNTSRSMAELFADYLEQRSLQRRRW